MEYASVEAISLHYFDLKKNVIMARNYITHLNQSEHQTSKSRQQIHTFSEYSNICTCGILEYIFMNGVTLLIKWTATVARKPIESLF